RSGNWRLAVAGGEALHFDDVAALIFQRSSHFIERVLSLLAQQALAGPEADFGLRGGLVLVNVAHHLLDAGKAGIGLLRGLLRRLGLVAGINGMQVGFVGLG